MVNASILYNEWCAIQGKPKLKQLKFLRNVINQIVEFVGPDGVRLVQRAVAHTCLSEQHFPSHIPQNNTKRRIALACFVCRPAMRKLENQNGAEKKKDQVVSQVLSVKNVIRPCVLPPVLNFTTHIVTMKLHTFIGNGSNLN